MARTAAIYLAHLNPMTKAHESIISRLKLDYNVYVFPVIFIKDGKEVNTKSFPFTYEIRSEMVRSVFGDSVTVLPAYTFFSPFFKYLPPLVSPFSWNLRNKIVNSIKEDRFISYTGDRTERIALKAYRLHPITSSRLDISASTVKDMLYKKASEVYKAREKSGNDLGGGEITHHEQWYDKVPAKVVELIKDNWKIVQYFADQSDNTTRIMGMKFPTYGLFN